jgi:ABC-type multidrug transport system fused ATPase/permease subunit
MNKIFYILDKEQKIAVIFLFFFGLIALSFELIGLGLIIPLIYSIIDQKFFITYPQFNFISILFGYPEKSELITYFLILIIGIYLIKNLFLTFLQWYEIKFLNNTRENISYKLFDIFLKKDINFHIKTNSSTLITYIKQDLGEYFRGLQSTIIIFIEGTLVIGIIIFLISYETKAFLVSGSVILTLSLIFYFLTSKQFQKIGKLRQEKEILRTQKLVEGFSGIREIKSFNTENLIAKNYEVLTKELSRIYRVFDFLSKLPKIYFEIIAVIGVVLLTYFLLQYHENSTRVIASIGVFSAAAFKMLPSFNRIQNAFAMLKYSEKAVNSIYQNFLFEKKNKIKKYILPPIKSKIKLERVSFKYENTNKNILKDLNFEIKLGDKICIMGQSGSGKSTLIDVISGLQVPTDGKILIDNNPIKKNYNWFDSIGYVPQDIFLFDDTIKYNITLEKSELIDENFLNLILETCQLKKFINSQPDKIDTLVGEDGIKISGGQKQRIGIARALYKKPQIILFDEATSALDKMTEKLLLENLVKLTEKQSIIFVTHKQITLETFKRKFEMKNSNLVEVK